MGASGRGVQVKFCACLLSTNKHSNNNTVEVVNFMIQVDRAYHVTYRLVIICGPA